MNGDEDLTNTLQSIRWYLDLVPGDVSKFDSMLRAFLRVHSVANPVLFWQAVDAIVKDIILHEGQPVWHTEQKASASKQG
jgi:capsule polysaccharide modification protein KpsS